MRMNRRTLLGQLGLASAASFLPGLRSARAATAVPRRFLIFYTQHGTLPWLWRPQGSGTSFTLGRLLAPLEPFKQDLILIDGLDFKGLKGPGSTDDFGCGHARGQSSSLTANIQTQGATAKAGGPSIDFYIADGLRQANGGRSPTAIPSQLAAIVENRPNVMSWGQPYQSAAGQTVLPERDALTVYRRLFPNGTPTMAGATPSRDDLMRKATLDYLASEYRVVQDRLGRFARERLEQNVTLVQDLRQRLDLSLQQQSAGNPACKAPEGVRANKRQSNYYDPLIWENTRPSVPRLMQAAFACDITRVFAIHVEDPPPRLYGGAGGYASTHDLVHAVDVAGRGGPVAQAERMYMEFTNIFLEVLQLLAAVTEADGKSLLYHTCVLWCGELAQPGHSTANAKWLTAGQLGGYLRTGQVLSYGGNEVRWNDGDRGDAVPSNGDVLTTIANGMGVPTARFGVNTRGELAAMKA